MSKAEEFLREHGHITEMTGNYPHRTEKSYIISDKTLHELMRVFAEQYAAEVSRESRETFMKTLDIKEDRKAIRKLRRFIKVLKEQEEQQ